MFRLAKVFNRGYIPLLRFRSKSQPNPKDAYLFGSCHSISVDRLSLNINPFYQMKDDFFLIDFLKNRKNLIVESAELMKDLDKAKDIIQTTDFKLRMKKLINYHKDDFDSTHFEKSSWTPNLLRLLKRDEIYPILNNSIDNPSLTLLGHLIYQTIISSGMDREISYHYLKSGKSVFELDERDDRKLYQNYYRIMRLTTVYYILHSKISRKSLIETIIESSHKVENAYLYNDWRDIKGNQNSYLLNGRNKKWILKIERLYHELEDPLFLVGCAHLHGLIDLLTPDYQFEIFHLEKRSFLPLT